MCGKLHLGSCDCILHALWKEGNLSLCWFSGDLESCRKRNEKGSHQGEEQDACVE